MEQRKKSLFLAGGDFAGEVAGFVGEAGVWAGGGWEEADGVPVMPEGFGASAGELALVAQPLVDVREAKTVKGIRGILAHQDIAQASCLLQLAAAFGGIGVFNQ